VGEKVTYHVYFFAISADPDQNLTYEKIHICSFVEKYSQILKQNI